MERKTFKLEGDFLRKIFVSYDEFYRYPSGAIKNNESIHFKIVLNRSLKCSGAKLVVIDDSTNKKIELEMFWCKDFGDGEEAWECDFKPQHIGIYWYYFDLYTILGRRWLSKGDYGEGIILEAQNNIFSWQITVYDKNFESPKWLNGGIMYQIFPDRFFNSGSVKRGVPDDRILKREWGEDFLKEKKEDINNCYYRGDLKGIEKKLPYLKSLGVTCIYLNPIFEAHSNHRYNTANYFKVDPMLGNKKDFKSLCKEAQKLDIKIILDGVFSHTGSDSVYFNKNRRYKKPGAFNSKESKYFNWYKFSNWPKDYVSWWGFETLPEVNENNSDFSEFITGKDGVLRSWIDMGAYGWRLDVADELPDNFIEKIRYSVKNKCKDALVLGEVWEDASNKESYGYRRKYLLGNELDSVMNYPFRNAIINFISTKNSKFIFNVVLNILENYPEEVVNNLMNMLSTHDTERIFTVVSNKFNICREKIIDLLKLAVAIQYTLPGIPSIFYGDEAGLTGGKDPFCRKCYPWGREDRKLISFYKKIGFFRINCPCLIDGKFEPVFIDDLTFSYTRDCGKDKKLICSFGFNNNEKILDILEINSNYDLINSLCDRYFSLHYFKLKDSLQK